jgi:pimeloyl-ACP methyl ester carboxylesterase/DNA-binding CsgD family transcriptional regulator
MEPQIQYARTRDGVSIAFWEMGSGPPLVHGWPSFSHIAEECRLPGVRRWYERLARNHRLVRYDPRGLGLSERETPVSFEAWVADLEAVVDHLGLARFDLFGIQHDALVAAAYASRHPERVSHLVLWQAYTRAADWASAPRIRAIRAMVDQDWPTYTEAMANVVYGWKDMEGARHFAGLARASLTPRALLAAMQELNTWDVSNVWPAITSPTLVMQRTDAPPVSVECAKEVSSSIPSARLVLLPGDATMPFQGDAGTVANTIEDFLAGDASIPVDPRRHDAHLSDREVEVLRLVAAGRTNKEIAEMLVISVNTVYRHVHNIFGKIEAANRAEATAYVYRSGLA